LLPKALEVADVSRKQLASNFGCFRLERTITMIGFAVMNLIYF
jgi:hypothetical protein